jgi:hypothetical protein
MPRWLEIPMTVIHVPARDIVSNTCTVLIFSPGKLWLR